MNNGGPASGDHLPGIGADPLRSEGARGAAVYPDRDRGFGLEVAPPGPLGDAQSRGLLRGVWRNLGIALGLGLLLATVAAVATWFGVPTSKYSARSMLHVQANPPQLALETKDRPLASGAVSEFVMFQKTQEQQIKSRLVLNKALSHPDVANFPR